MEIRTVECEDAKDLLDRLRIRHPMWRGARLGEIAFRGHAKSEWKLIPSAFRASSTLGACDDVRPRPFSDVTEQCRAEYLAVLEFLRLADRVGLRVPGDGALFRSYHKLEAVLEDSFATRTWPSEEVWQTLAIAQHHGVPTRLLDFTYHPLVSAFFAAEGAITDEQPSHNMAVWAIDLRYIRSISEYDPGVARVHDVTVPRADNAFLHAQHGLFILDTGVNAVWNSGLVPSIEEVVCKSVEHWRGRDGVWGDTDLREKCIPPVTKLILPTTEAGELLRLLDYEGITRAHLRPTYDGVVEAMALMRKMGQD